VHLAPKRGLGKGGRGIADGWGGCPGRSGATHRRRIRSCRQAHHCRHPHRRVIQYAAASRGPHWRLWNTGSPGRSGAMTAVVVDAPSISSRSHLMDIATHEVPFSRRCSRPSFAGLSPLITRGAGEAGCRLHPWPACRKKCRRQSPQVRAEHPASPARWSYGCSVVSPVRRAFWSPLPAQRVGAVANVASASGCQDPTAWPCALGLSVDMIAHAAAQSAHRIPHPTSVTVAKRPSIGTGCRQENMISGKKKEEYFWREDWTGQIRLMRFDKSGSQSGWISCLWRGPLRSFRQQLGRTPSLRSIRA
jgi:hypothetical protein